MQGLKEKVAKYFQGYSTENISYAYAPGRINIIGEHIDYNDGFVLPMAIDSGVVAGAVPVEEMTCTLVALDMDETVCFELGEAPTDPPGWTSYIFGTISEWYDKGYISNGLKLAFAGDVPKGSGLSSSAALEVSTALAIAEVFGISISSKELALHCQYIEHHYTGVQCGIMDQYASVFGKTGFALHLDCMTLEHTYVPMELSEHCFVLCQTGVSHSLAESSYNDRRRSADKALKQLNTMLGIGSWREVGRDDLEMIRGQNTEYRRALHIHREIERVKQSVQAMATKDMEKLGQLMYQSHSDLKNNYEVSCDELDFLVESAQDFGTLGARMMGGGFGGCTINLMHRDEVGSFTVHVQEKFSRKYKRSTPIIIVNSGPGASVMSS